jgi:hypothetical protein
LETADTGVGDGETSGRISRAWEISGMASNDESFHRIVTFTYVMDWRWTARGRRDSSDRDFARDCMVRVWVWVSKIFGRRLRWQRKKKGGVVWFF